MTLAAFNMRVLAPVSVGAIVLALQPAFEIQPAYSVSLTLLGLLGVVVFTYIQSHPGMTFREFNARFFERLTMWLMIGGVILLCQPWFGFLHAYSIFIALMGLIGFNVAAHVPPPEQKADEDDTGPGPVSDIVGKGHGHG
jgi:hypothetical protein